MRPDEGGCADLRRSLAAHTKVVRSGAYAPARRQGPHAGARRCQLAGACDVSRRGPRSRRYRGRRRRPAPTRPRRPGTVRTRPARRAWPRPPGPASAHGIRAQPPATAASAASSMVAHVGRYGTRGARATRCSSCAWSSSSTLGSSSASASIRTGSLPPGMRRASIAVPASRSRGPISMRTGTPLSSQSTARRPKGVSVRSSTWTRRPAAFSRSPISRTLATRLVALDRHDDDLDGRQPRRDPQAVVVAVRHDQAADHAGRGAPGGLPDQLLLAVLRQVRGC